MTDVIDFVYENSVAYLTIYFWDKNNVAASPASGTWSVHDIGTSTIMKAPTYFPTIASSVDVILTTPINTLINSANAEETRRVTIRAFFTDGECWNDYDYNVLGLKFAP